MNKLKITHLYSKLMNLYGDYGNIASIKMRCLWRDIDVEIEEVNINENIDINSDIVFIGGGQDKDQELIAKDLHNKKSEIRDLVAKDIPLLAVCGGYQLLGEYYENYDGNRIEGIGIFKSYTKNFGKENPRCVGNILIETRLGQVIGFENHGGRTFLRQDSIPFGKVIKGFGNNAEDKTEGEIVNNAIGTYIHGSLLPKNPVITDNIIKIALKNKYGDDIELKELDDTIEKAAFNQALQSKYIEIVLAK